MVADALLEQEIEIICANCLERGTCKKICPELKAQLPRPSRGTTRVNGYEVLTQHGETDCFPGDMHCQVSRGDDGVWRGYDPHHPKPNGDEAKTMAEIADYEYLNEAHDDSPDLPEVFAYLPVDAFIKRNT